MNWAISAVLGLFIVLSNPAHSAACAASTTSTGTGAADGSNCTITGTQSTIQLNFIGGFNSATGLSAVGGNGGTTLGAQRMLSFIKAIEIISDQVESAQTIIVDANFSALSCSANEATLGSAGPSVSLYHPSAPGGMTNNTWYPIGLYNHFANSDNFSPGDDVYTGNSTGSDINSNFNSNLGTSGCLENSSGWYYGFDETPSANYIGFTTVLLHEITHGLGFTSLVSPQTGAKSSGFDDVFSNNLYDVTLGAWPAMTDAQRADSVVSVTGLLWAGSNVNTQAVGLLTNGFNDVDSDGNFESGDKVEMYAPCASSGNAQYDYVSGDCLYEGGSSVSHFSTDASPNELMEPQYTQYTDSLGLALYLLKDIGWTVVAPSANNAPTITITGTPYSTDEDTPKVIDASGWDADIDGDTVTFTVSSCPANITCAIDSDGQNLTLTPASNYNSATNSVEITVADDGVGALSASASFNLDVIAQNDAPEWSAISTQSVTIGGSSVDLDLSNYASDAEGHTLSYSQVSCGTGLSCSLTGSTMTLGGISNDGATVTVEVQADDNNGEQTNKTFSVTINAAAANTPPTITTINQTTNEDSPLTIDISGWGNDAEDALTYSVLTNCASNITCSIDTDGTNFVMTPSENHNGNSHTITVTVDDNTNSTVSDTFDLNVSAVDDDPALDTAITDKTTTEDTSITLDVSDLATDVDSDDSLSYSISACATGIDCTISSDGSVLTLTPDPDQNGATHTITVSVSDENGGTPVTDSFNLNITAVNDAPNLTNPGNLSLEVNTLLSFNLSATDVESDTITYGVSASQTEAGVSIVDNTVTLLPTQIGIYQITVNASDSNLTTEQTFNLNVFEVPTVDVNGTILEPNENTVIDNSDVVLDLTGVTSNSNYSLDYEGNLSDSLISVSGETLTIGMPSSGAFAGTYTLTITNSDSGISYDFSLVRTPRLNFSAINLLEEEALQTLKIEGGLAGTVYTLTSSEAGLSFMQNNSAVSNASAIDDADNYNPATVTMVVSSISSSATAEVLASSIYETATYTDISLEPKATHTITIQNSLSEPLAQSIITLNRDNLVGFNFDETYNTNSNGEATILLPETSIDYNAVISLSGYISQAFALNSSMASQTITLEEVSDPLNLSGTITGDGSIAFDSELPTVVLTLSDNTEIALTVNLINSTQAEFDYIHDLNTGDVKSLTISHTDSESIVVNLLTRTSLVFDIRLNQRAQIVVISTDSAGSINLPFLIFFALFWMSALKNQLTRKIKHFY